MSDLLQLIEDHVVQLFEQHTQEQFSYHNLQHTRAVVDNTKLIGEHAHLNDEEMTIVQVAAWFHDTGYIFSLNQHEQKGQELARNLLLSYAKEEAFIQGVENCIAATRFPQRPTCKLSEILCDADMAHLADPSFFDISLQFRDEQNNITGKRMSKRKYWKETLQIFDKHHYYTAYGKSHLEPAKQRNYQLLLKKLQKLEDKKVLEQAQEMIKNQAATEIKNMGPAQANTANAPLDELRITRSFKEPSRGIETMFRISGRNQMTLSSIADNKANMMISVNSIIISVVLGTFYKILDDSPMLVYPMLILLAVCLTTIVIAVLATRPNVSGGHFTKSDIAQRKVNLLFFGNFYNVDLPTYEWGMHEVMNDYDYLYTTLIRDQYYLGKVLAKKYKLLRLTYNIFMFGLIVTVLAFAVAILAF